MLRYLVDPIFQVINTAGKPATGGYIEVYLHGTRDKYYCASDFNGTLHPFKIPLDSLGANIILADDANAYDIYVYNRYGSLLMSRYNVVPSASGDVSSDDIKPLVLNQFGKILGTYSPLNGNTIDIGDSAVHVAVDHANIHEYLTEILADGRTPVLVMSDTDPDTPGVTRDFYFYPTARTGVDSDYSFIGYDGEVVKVATVHDDDTVTYSTYGAQIPFDYTADVMYSPNIKVNSLGQTVLVQKGRPNRLVVKYSDLSPQGYTVTATDIQRGYISINLGLPSFYLNGELVTPNFLMSYNYKFTTSIKGLETDANKLAMFKRIRVITYRNSDLVEETLALATDFSKDEYGRSLSAVHGLVSDSIYVRTYVKVFATRGHRFDRLLARYYFDYDYNNGVMANLQVGDSLGQLPSVSIIMDPIRDINYQQEVNNG